MPIATKKCRVCGKEYEACHTARVKAGSFRWQDVACSPECGAEYFALILKSRGETTPEEQPAVSDSEMEYETDDTEKAEEDHEKKEAVSSAPVFRSGKKKKFRK